MTSGLFCHESQATESQALGKENPQQWLLWAHERYFVTASKGRAGHGSKYPLCSGKHSLRICHSSHTEKQVSLAHLLLRFSYSPKSLLVKVLITDFKLMFLFLQREDFLPNAALRTAQGGLETNREVVLS